MTKYLEYPVVQENSQSRLEKDMKTDEKRPVVYACQQGQFNYLRVVLKISIS